ncbi:hepatitis A virus cellular receptor 1 homolog isoform X1 [Cricetulus griseus]|uniref:hepatitis A virus cellular receptor 1 homolog isoform X1 n=1 Tax=Cricetulus griseus TaxID=10029 RepID=UPI0004546360|nr:hepatitis A virus cellular receptor 1 homolog isoform X1 [Cricetulus griseus]
MMLHQVFISGLLLLLPGAVDSDVVVTAVVGDPVTLPCIYSTDLGISNSCWGLGECKFFYCARTLIWTNGYRVTYQRSSRYQLKGPISEGNVSLTIENAAQSDSGPYCCVVEIPGSFRYATYSLEVKPEIPTSPPTSPTTITGPTTTGRPTTVSTRPIHLPTSPTVSTSTPTTPAQTETHTTDWNNTVTSSNNSWDNYTVSIFFPNQPCSLVYLLGYNL